MQVDENMPLQAYLLQYQTILHEETREVIKDESVYISQVISDLEKDLTKFHEQAKSSSINTEESNHCVNCPGLKLTKKMDDSIKNVTFVSEKLNEAINDIHLNLSKKMNEHISNVTFITEKLDKTINVVQMNLYKKFENIEIKISNRIQDQIENLTRSIFEGLVQTINNVKTELKNDILDLTQNVKNSEKMMQDHIRNSTLVSEKIVSTLYETEIPLTTISVIKSTTISNEEFR